jgi:hypothetical protein
MNIKAKNKSTILSDNLAEFFGSKMNQARIKFFGLTISALCKIQTVSFEKLACSFDSEAKIESSLRRIQRFISEYVLDTHLIARFIFSLLPHEPSYRLINRNLLYTISRNIQQDHRSCCFTGKNTPDQYA